MFCLCKAQWLKFDENFFLPAKKSHNSVSRSGEDFFWLNG
jgi:hypothetical protein